MYTLIDNVASRQPLVMRILVRPFAYRHPRVFGGMCSVAGLWLVVLGVILFSYRFWWGAALVTVGALELWIAYRLLHVATGARNGQGAR